MSISAGVPLLDWPAAARGGSATAGGKGWNLGRLARYGLPVPPGVVLGVEAYLAFIHEAGLDTLIERIENDPHEPASGAPLLATLADRCRRAALPRAVREAIEAALADPLIGGGPLAVRSSAVAEDGAAASFAGVHESFLHVPPNVQAVGEALKACFASLWAPSAVAYRRQRQTHAPAAMAVVLMRMVPAVMAGIAFSADPRTGRRDRVVIAANFGLGESVVAGAVDADEFHVRMGLSALPRVVSRRLGRKQRRTAPAPGGGTHLADAALDGAASTLDDAQASQLALLVQRCQDALSDEDEPYDVEWAHDGACFWIVQARPVTALPEPSLPALVGQPTIWSTANLREVMPPVFTPYSWSAVRPGMVMMMEALLERSGMSLPKGLRWLRLHQGHPYLNLSLMQWLLYDAFGSPPAQTNRSLGGHQPEIRLPPGSPFAGRAGLMRVGRVLWQLVTAERVAREVERANRQQEPWARRYWKHDFVPYSDLELREQLLSFGQNHEAFSHHFMRANSLASLWVDLLVMVLQRFLPDDGAALASRLLAGTGGIASAEQGYRLVEIAHLAAGDERARSFFLEGGDPSAWETALAGTRAGAALQEFLDDFGHRAVGELEFLNPRWRENPAYLLATIRDYVASSVAAPERRGEAQRTQAERALRRALRFHPGLPVVQWALKAARRASALRENAKSTIVLTMMPPRRLGLEVGRRAVARGHLDAVDDYFFLTFADVLAFLGGLWDGSGARALVADRRQRYEAEGACEVPEVLLDDRPHRPLALDQRAADRAGDAFVGIGVAGGRATGPARVLRDPRDGDRLQPGDVLVAPTTDPAWSPLFLRASAVVMELGGYLSHGAIVAREYGIPAVGNLPGIVNTLDDGDVLEVDGDRGRVRRLAPRP